MSGGVPPPALVITGPTAIGKSELAVEVAERIGGEIISADSRQVHRGMDIGTAKPDARLRQRVPHRGLDLLEPCELYSAGRFARDAWRWIYAIRARGRTPIIAGGTGFFIRALFEPLAPEPDFDPEWRRSLRRYLTGLGPDELARWLGRLDPARARELQGEGGTQRRMRSLEVVLLSGVPHTRWMGRPHATPSLVAPVFRLELPRGELYARIDRRLDEMMRAGFLDEVRELLTRYPAASPGMRTMGYAELASSLGGSISLDAAVEAAKRRTRRYARRQLTWLRHQLPDTTVSLDALRPRHELAAEIARHWSRAAG